MDDTSRVFVEYDHDPGVITQIDPTDAAYEGVVELARGLHPGQRKRLYGSAGTFRVNEDGAFTVETLISSGAALYPSQNIVTPSDRTYACYRSTLGLPEADSDHPYLYYDRDRILACLGRRSMPPAAPDGEEGAFVR